MITQEGAYFIQIKTLMNTPERAAFRVQWFWYTEQSWDGVGSEQSWFQGSRSWISWVDWKKLPRAVLCGPDPLWTHCNWPSLDHQILGGSGLKRHKTERWTNRPKPFPVKQAGLSAKRNDNPFLRLARSRYTKLHYVERDPTDRSDKQTEVTGASSDGRTVIRVEEFGRVRV